MLSAEVKKIESIIIFYGEFFSFLVDDILLLRRTMNVVFYVTKFRKLFCYFKTFLFASQLYQIIDKEDVRHRRM
jgi:hypothetical protein